MKKFFAVLLLAAMLLSLWACGKQDTPTVPTTGNSGGTTEKDPLQSEFTWKKFDTSATLEKKTVTSKDGNVLTFDKLEYDGDSAIINFTLKNNGEEARVAMVEAVSVNGVMIQSSASVWTEPGEEKQDVIYLTLDAMRLYGIFEIAELDLQIQMYNEEWEDEELIDVELKTSAQATNSADDYIKAVNSAAAQETLGFNVVETISERKDLGNDLYLESIVYMQIEDGSYLLLEVDNEGEQMRNAYACITQINKLGAYDGLDMNIYPGAKAILQLDAEWALPSIKREVFGMSEIYEILYDITTYDCDENGEIVWDDEEKTTEFTYKVPEAEVKAPDMTGTVLYEQEGLRILAKEPVTNDWDETYIYMIYEADPELGLSVEEDWEKEIQVDGTCEYSLLSTPGFLEEKYTVGYLELDYMEAESATVYLTLYDYNADADFVGTPLELKIEF